MGAGIFERHVQAPNSKEAHRIGFQEAQEEHGSRGYTGSMAEKPTYRYFLLPEDLPVEEVMEYLGLDLEPLIEKYPQHELLIKRIDNTFNDKWGPAVCLRLKEGHYVFTGLASC